MQTKALNEHMSMSEIYPVHMLLNKVYIKSLLIRWHGTFMAVRRHHPAEVILPMESKNRIPFNITTQEIPGNNMSRSNPL